MPPERTLIGFVGPSGIGKTTLLESVIHELVSAGLRVGVVKHTSHSVLADHPGKDSHRLYTAGADAVVLRSPDQLISFQRRSGDEPHLADSLAALPDDLEVVLIEGFLHEPIPRYVLLPRNGSDERGYAGLGEVLRVIHAPPSPPNTKPRFDPMLVKEISAQIIARVSS